MASIMDLYLRDFSVGSNKQLWKKTIEIAKDDKDQKKRPKHTPLSQLYLWISFLFCYQYGIETNEYKEFLKDTSGQSDYEFSMVADLIGEKVFIDEDNKEIDITNRPLSKYFFAIVINSNFPYPKWDSYLEKSIL